MLPLQVTWGYIKVHVKKVSMVSVYIIIAKTSQSQSSQGANQQLPTVWQKYAAALFTNLRLSEQQRTQLLRTPACRLHHGAPPASPLHLSPHPHPVFVPRWAWSVLCACGGGGREPGPAWPWALQGPKLSPWERTPEHAALWKTAWCSYAWVWPREESMPIQETWSSALQHAAPPGCWLLRGVLAFAAAAAGAVSVWQRAAGRRGTLLPLFASVALCWGQLNNGCGV